MYIVLIIFIFDVKKEDNRIIRSITKESLLILQFFICIIIYKFICIVILNFPKIQSNQNKIKASLSSSI